MHEKHDLEPSVDLLGSHWLPPSIPCVVQRIDGGNQCDAGVCYTRNVCVSESSCVRACWMLCKAIVAFPWELKWSPVTFYTVDCTTISRTHSCHSDEENQAERPLYTAWISSLSRGTTVLTWFWIWNNSYYSGYLWLNLKVEKCIVVFRLSYVTFFLLFSRFDSKWLSGSFRILHRASLLKRPLTFKVGQFFF